MIKYDILYKGRRIYQNLTAEDCSEILQTFSERCFSGEDINLNEIELEETLNG